MRSHDHRRRLPRRRDLTRRIIGSEAPADQLRVSTFGGDDDVAVAPDVFQLIAPTVDLGLGER